MASCGLLTVPATFADLKVLVKVLMPISNASVDKNGPKEVLSASDTA